MIAVPFDPFDAKIDAVIGDQLTGADHESLADRILAWDAENSRYIKAFHADHTGDGQIDGRWFSEFTNYTPSDIVFVPGHGYWIENRQAFDQSLILAGQLVASPTNSRTLLPQLNSIGYPYSSAVAFDDSALAEVGMAGSDDTLLLGEGYWLLLTNESAVVWSEVRPYDLVFADENATLYIKEVKMDDDGESVALVIKTDIEDSSAIDIWYQDIRRDSRFDPSSGWIAAERKMAIKSDETVWRDAGSSDRLPVSGIFARYYTVSPTGISPNADPFDLSKPRKGKAASSMAGRSTASQTGIVGQTNDFPGVAFSALSNSAGAHPASGIRMLARIIYVDKHRGDDSLDGRAPRVMTVGSLNLSGRPSSVGPELAQSLPGADQVPALQTNSTPVGPHLGERPSGPKKTIRQGFRAARLGDTVIIETGHYNENLNIAGKNVKVRINGTVNLSSRPASGGMRVRASDSSGIPVHSTNGINRAKNERR